MHDSRYTIDYWRFYCVSARNLQRRRHLLRGFSGASYDLSNYYGRIKCYLIFEAAIDGVVVKVLGSLDALFAEYVADVKGKRLLNIVGIVAI